MNKKRFGIFPDFNSLPAIFQKYSGIQAVYVFGSAASGRLHDESDLDLAVYSHDSSIHAQRLDILADLTRQGFNNVDLVFLDKNDVVLRFEAVRQNRLIYCAKDFDASAFFSLVLRQYFDFAPYLKTQREAYKRRVLHDGQNRSYS
ncbi:MAG: nucleotidyltransferase domain-containing protein [Chloroflexi bacterium]|nr:nucleotidyltransferase domain-containing protein [Chloroflexota bacterium]